ncbi:MAG: thioredoxin-disulfide reductase [Buchnera aphidicola (Nurudea yanoniella)]
MNKNVVQHKKLIIIGSGPAGCTAAIYASRANLSPLLFTGANPGGQLINTNSIENWPGDPQVISGIKLMNRMENHVKLFNTTIISEAIIKVNFKKNPFELVSESHKKYTSDAIIIATGAQEKYLGLLSEKKFKGKGVSTCAICDGFFYKNKNVAVVGGGNSAIEAALYLSNIAQKVYLIHRKNSFRAEKILVERLLKKAKNNRIILYQESTVHDILGDKKGVTGINIICCKKIKKIQVSGIFITIGHKPNTKIFLNQLTMKNDYIVVESNLNGNFTQTSIPGIFAAGDVIDYTYKQAITAASSGCMAALDAEKFLGKIENFTSSHKH